MTLVGLLVPAPSAIATFAGENGKIAYHSATCTGSVCESDIYSINPDGTGRTNLTNRVGAEGPPQWSPDGNRIAFAANYGGQYDLYVMNADGSGITQLTSAQSVSPADVSWSPDGSKILFTALGVIYTINADGSGLTPLGGANASQPAWSPDQTKIAFAEKVTCGQSCDRIDVMNADGTDRRQLTDGLTEDIVPLWSPDGSKIAFMRDGRVYLINPDGSGARLLDGDPTCWINQQEFLGGWSPVDDRVTFGWQSEGDCLGNGNAYALIKTFHGDGTDGRTLRVLTDLSGPSPAFSPDGGRIAVDDGTGFVFTIRSTDGGDYHEFGGEWPDWQPVLRGYARPKGATPVRVSLVPAFASCTAPNRTHGAPLSYPSCNAPVSTSSTLTIGVGDGSPALAKSIGSVRLDVVPGNVDMRVSLTNVMRRADLSDYTGELRLELPLRITDHLNTPYPGGLGPGTVTDTSIFATVPCTATADTTLGGACVLVSSADALLPGASPAGARSVWALGPVRVYDGGPDEDADTAADNSVLATQGVFVP